MTSSAVSWAFIAAFFSFVVYVTNERGNWSIGSFIFNLLASAFITGIFLLFGSLIKSRDMRLMVFCLYLVIMAVYLQKAQELKVRDDLELEARRVEMQKYEAWYNSLNPYQKLQVDNERLQEENSRLQQRE